MAKKGPHYELMYKNKKLTLVQQKRNEENTTKKKIKLSTKFDEITKRRIFSPYLDQFLSQAEIEQAVKKIR
jgi:hypothetical protein